MSDLSLRLTIEGAIDFDNILFESEEYMSHYISGYADGAVDPVEKFNAFTQELATAEIRISKGCFDERTRDLTHLSYIPKGV